MDTGMGDRHSDGGSRVPARDGSASSADGLRLALSRALRAEVLDAPAEQRVLAAFRAARDSGSHQRADTRKRDDWRPRPRPARRSLRAAVGVLVSGLVLSGVAVAAIGTPGKGHDQRQDDDGRAPRRPSASAPAAPASSAPTPYDTASPASPVPPAGPSAAPTPDRPPTAEDIQVHCRAYPSARGSGKALESAAWQRFLAAAGGEDNVAAHCADHLRQAPPGNPGKAQDGSQGDTPRPTAEQGRPSQAAEKSKGPPAQQE
jgi:hypothetical protein